MWLLRKKEIVSDEELVKKYFSSGEQSLIGDLFERHVKTVYGVCLFYFKDKHQASDAVMQIFEKLMIELRKTEVKNFKAWLGFVVRNYCISELRKSKHQRFVSEAYLDFEVAEPVLEEEERIGRIQDEEMLEKMRQMLPKLKEKHRLCLDLFYMQDKSYQDISEQTGYSLNEVKSYIQNGKRNLKLLIEELKRK